MPRFEVRHVVHIYALGRIALKCCTLRAPNASVGLEFKLGAFHPWMLMKIRVYHRALRA